MLAMALLAVQAPSPRIPDYLDARKEMAALAVQQHATDIPPIPLEPRSTSRGMIFDAFRLYHLAAREASRSGAQLTADAAARLDAPQLLIVASPVMCGGIEVAPVSIGLTGARGVAAPRNGSIAGEALEKWLPGVPLAAGAIGAAFDRTFGPDGAVTVTYASDACRAPKVLLPIEVARPRKKINVAPAWPVGALGTPASGPIQVHLRVVIDLEGVPRNIEVLSRPSEFNLAAVAAVRQWRYEPWRVNGVATPMPMSVFTSFALRRQEIPLW